MLLANGKSIPIADLKPGDKALATNTKTGKTQAETITRVLVRHDTNLYDLRIKSRGRVTVIHTTSNHLFWDPYLHHWVSANKLSNGMHLLTANGTVATADGGTTPKVRDGWMWDLTVPGNGDHDFYVLAAPSGSAGNQLTFHVQPGSISVLVHNSGGPGPCAIGQAGEAASGITRNYRTIIINGRARIPDELDPAARIIGEVKNVKYQYLSTQLKDDMSYAQANGFQFNLYVNSGTRLSGPLQDVVNAGIST